MTHHPALLLPTSINSEISAVTFQSPFQVLIARQGLEHASRIQASLNHSQQLIGTHSVSLIDSEFDDAARLG